MHYAFKKLYKISMYGWNSVKTLATSFLWICWLSTNYFVRVLSLAIWSLWFFYYYFNRIFHKLSCPDNVVYHIIIVTWIFQHTLVIIRSKGNYDIFIKMLRLIQLSIFTKLNIQTKYYPFYWYNIHQSFYTSGTYCLKNNYN